MELWFDLLFVDKGDVKFKKIGFELVLCVDGYKWMIVLLVGMVGYKLMLVKFDVGLLVVGFEYG